MMTTMTVNALFVNAENDMQSPRRQSRFFADLLQQAQNCANVRNSKTTLSTPPFHLLPRKRVVWSVMDRGKTSRTSCEPRFLRYCYVIVNCEQDLSILTSTSVLQNCLIIYIQGVSRNMNNTISAFTP